MKKIKYKTGDSVYYKDPEGNEWEATIKHTQSWNNNYIITLDNLDGNLDEINKAFIKLRELNSTTINRNGIIQINFVTEENLRPSWKKREEKINKILGISSDN